MRLADPQDHGLQEAVEAAEQDRRRDLRDIPRADRVFRWLEQGVLPDPLSAAQHQRVVDLLGRPLHPVRQPGDDMLGIGGVDFVHVVDPQIRLGGIAGYASECGKRPCAAPPEGGGRPAIW